jgi:hypothetical protein
MQESPIVFLVVVALVRRAAVRFGVACAGTSKGLAISREGGFYQNENGKGA